MTRMLQDTVVKCQDQTASDVFERSVHLPSNKFTNLRDWALHTVILTDPILVATWLVHMRRKVKSDHLPAVVIN
jgi:hypothetical protein